MVFSSPIFLFLFLTIVLSVYLLLPGLQFRNTWLLLTSLVFYAWGEVSFVFLLLFSTSVNYGLGLWIDRSQDERVRKRALTLGLVANIGLLAFFKYAMLFVASLDAGMRSVGAKPFPVPAILLPIGISFFTFHAISYLMDIYRRKWKAARDPNDVALYIFFFPQLIAGPILRWNAIAPQLAERRMSREQFAEGIRRFVGGLGKKMLIANTVALPADQIFGLPTEELSAGTAWLGIACYTLQIYFDFSGYSDMAVGLGKMFGFKFLENFDFPYTAQSIKDFWRRWHISLSTWFRDYLYIPLGGNRVSEARNYLNLLIVFFLCGLWHGASWTFVLWGLFHGGFLVLERTRFGEWQAALPRALRHGYTLLIVMMGWVLFRCDPTSMVRADTDLTAWKYYLALFGLGHAPAAQPIARYLNSELIWAIAAGIIFSGPTWAWLKAKAARLGEAAPAGSRAGVETFGAALEAALVMGLLIISATWLAAGTYNPFIYFRF